MNAIYIARARFSKSARNPFTILMVLLNFLVIFISSLLPYFTFDPQSEIIFQADISISSTFIISTIICIYFASTSVSSEIEDKLVFTILSKPVSSASYMIGNLIGIIAILMLVYYFSYILSDFILYLSEFRLIYSKNHIKDVLFGYLSFKSSHGYIIYFFFLSFLLSFLLVSLSLSLSSLSGFLFNISACVSLYFVGAFISSLEGALELLWIFVAALFPLVGIFDHSDALVLGAPPDLGVLGLATTYSLAYSSMWLALGIFFLHKKDFS